MAGVRLFREGLAEALSAFEQFDVSQRSSAAEAARGDGQPPDIALVDVADAKGFELVLALCASQADLKVVALGVTEHERSEVVRLAEAGVAGYVTRDASLRDLVAVLEASARGEVLCPPRMVAALLGRIATLAAAVPPQPAPPTAEITAREAEILDLVDQGLSNKEIAARLCIEVATVKNHLHNVMQKLQVSRRTEAAARTRTRRVARLSASRI